ncbi:MAG TPA: retropepsin-like aspartic protease, partial [Caulobacteraceae bacterium]
MTSRLAALTALAVLSLLLPPAPAKAACNVHIMATLPVTMQGTRPLVEARINGAPAMFMADSGAFYSFISPGAAAQFHLHPVAAPFGMRVKGVGGSAELSVADVRDFTLAGIPVPHAQFFVGGSETGGRAQGIIGRNILSMADVEYDLAGGAIRLLRTDGCRGASLAYWAKP